jgi:hypothetical protein
MRLNACSSDAVGLNRCIVLGHQGAEMCRFKQAPAERTASSECKKNDTQKGVERAGNRAFVLPIAATLTAWRSAVNVSELGWVGNEVCNRVQTGTAWLINLPVSIGCARSLPRE